MCFLLIGKYPLLTLKVNKNKVLAHIAQEEEHVLGKDEVTGSNPVVGFVLYFGF